MLHNVIRSGIFITILFVVLAFGAAREWSVKILEALSFILGILFFISVLIGKIHFRKSDLKILLPLILFLLFLLFQIIPLSFSWLHYFSPKWHTLYSEFQLESYRQVFVGLSVAWYVTFGEFLKVTAYFLIFVMVYKLFNYGHIKRFLIFVSTVGVLVALMGIAQHYLTPNKLYFVIEPPEGIAKSFGIIYNPNNYAGFITLALLPLIAFAAGGFRQMKVFQIFGAVLGLGIGLFSVVLCGSAGGLAAYVGGVCFFALIYSFHESVSKSYFRKLLSLILWCVIPIIFFGFFLVVFSSDNFNEFYKTLFDPGFRGLVYQDSLRYFKDFFIFGSGLGTFSYVFPIYQSFSSSGFFVYVENEYLQLLLETGAVGFLILAIFIFALFKSFVSLMKKGSGRLFLFSLCLMSALLACLSHNLVDFGLHLPVNAVLFFIYAALIMKLEKIMIHNVRRTQDVK